MMRPPKPKPCVIRGCDRPPVLWIGYEGYMCEHHADNVWRKVERRDAEKCDELVPGAEAREYDRADARAKRAVETRKPVAMGEIYFVQVDGLIKVGWTTKLADRIRAYGPKGREWYSDIDVIRAFITEATQKHGPPRFRCIEWTTPKQIVAGKRHR